MTAETKFRATKQENAFENLTHQFRYLSSTKKPKSISFCYMFGS